MNRRNFFKKAFGLAGAALCWPFMKSKAEELTVDKLLASKESLATGSNSWHWAWYRVDDGKYVRISDDDAFGEYANEEKLAFYWHHQGDLKLK